jgi:hypothetical protein
MRIGCPICKYFQFDGTCTAFEQGIPFGFLAGIAHHTEPVRGQGNDLVFEWISPEEQGKRRAEAITSGRRCQRTSQASRCLR